MTAPTAPRSIRVARTGPGQYVATNGRGGELRFGSGGDERFTPVELLLTAIGGCSGIDVDMITGKRAVAEPFDVDVIAESVRDADGHHLQNIGVTFRLTFPSGSGGDAAREILPTAIQRSHDRLCTVSRTVELGTPVTMRAADGD